MDASHVPDVNASAQIAVLDAAVPVGWVGMGRGLIATLDDAHVTLRDL